LDKIKKLEAEVERLKKQTPQELVNKVIIYEKEINELKVQLQQIQQQNGQLKAKIEVKEIRKQFS
jgi:predicted RNase H-like nuclease (RuvC/YqgF family)